MLGFGKISITSKCFFFLVFFSFPLSLPRKKSRSCISLGLCCCCFSGKHLSAIVRPGFSRDGLQELYLVFPRRWRSFLRRSLQALALWNCSDMLVGTRCVNAVYGRGASLLISPYSCACSPSSPALCGG